jgi:hypothetical protein
MNRSSRAATFVVALVAVGAWAMPAAAATRYSTASVTGGGRLLVTLPAPNAGSTGYHWAVSTQAPKSLLRRTSNRFSGNRQLFTFRAGRAGVALLRFRYVPPGRGRKAIKRYFLTVEVNRPAPRLRCYPPHSHTVISNAQARLFWIRRSVTIAVGSAPYRYTYRQYYGCAFSRERAHPLDNLGSNGSANAGDNSYNLIRLKGTTAGFMLAKGCPFVLGGGCGIGPFVVSSQDLRTGRLIRRVRIGDFAQSEGPNDVSGLVMSRRGGLAWIEFEGRDVNSVHRSDKGPKAGRRSAHDNTVLDNGLHGYVDFDSLHAESGGFRWKNRGVFRHASLR